MNTTAWLAVGVFVAAFIDRDRAGAPSQFRLMDIGIGGRRQVPARAGGTHHAHS